MAGLIQLEEQTLIPDLTVSKKQSRAISDYLSYMAAASATSVGATDMPTNVDGYRSVMETENGEKRVRQSISDKDQAYRDENFNNFLTEKAMSGATSLEIAELMRNRSQLTDPSRSVLERKASEFLVNAGLQGAERSAIVANEEANTDLADPTKTDVLQDSLTTVARMRTIKERLADRYANQGFLDTTFEVLSMAVIPFYSTASEAAVFGRKGVTLGGSVAEANRQFWVMPLKQRLEALDKFEKDLENNGITGQNTLVALAQLDELLHFKSEDEIMLTLTEGLDATIAGGFLTRLYKGVKTVYSAAKLAGAKNVAVNRAVELNQQAESGKIMSAGEEDELIRAVIPSMDAIADGQIGSDVITIGETLGKVSGVVSKGEMNFEGPTGPALQALKDNAILKAWEDLRPQLAEDALKIGKPKEAASVAGKTQDDIVFSPVELLMELKGVVTPRVLSATEQAEANLEAAKELFKRYNLNPELLAKVDPDEVTRGVISSRSYPLYDTQVDELNGITTVHVYLGTGEDKLKGFVSEAAARAGAERLGLNKNFYSVSDASGEYYIRVSKDAGSKRFISPIKDEELPFVIPQIGKWLQGSTTIFTKDAKEGARLVTNAQSKLAKLVTENFKRVGNLTGEARESYVNLLKDVQQKREWKTSGQVNAWYKDNYGRAPTAKEMDAYVAHRQLHNFDWFVRDSNTRQELVLNNYQEVGIKGFNKSPMVGRVVGATNVDPKFVRIFDTAEGKVKIYTADTISKRLKATEDTVLVELLERGRGRADYVITTNADLQTKPIRHGVLANKEGPHVIYDTGATGGFIKQADIEMVHGQELMRSPKTHFAISSGKEGKKFAEDYNKALDAYKVANATGKSEDIARATTVINELTRYSSYEEFAKLVKNGTIKSTPFEFVRAGELTKYRQDGLGRTLAKDPARANFSEFLNEALDNGRLFMSERGPRLPHPKEGMAALLDPTDILTRAVSNVVSTAAFQNFKSRQMERWVNTYGKYLQDKTNRPFVERFMYGEFDKSSTPEFPLAYGIQNKAEAQRMALIRFMNNPGVLGVEGDKMRKAVAQYIDGKGYTSLADKFDDVASSNFMGFARGAVFKTQFFMDVSQTMVQISMWPGMMAVSPVAGTKAFAMYPLIRSSLLNAKHDEAMGQVAQKLTVGAVKAKDYARMLADIRKSGIDIVDGNLAELDNIVGVSAANGYAKQLAGKTVEAGMTFYKEGEKASRVLGFSIAWLEDFAKTGKGLETADDFARVGVRGNAISSNMNKDGKAFWQEGILSVPSQFAGHTARVAELLLHPNAGFSTAEKARFYGALALTYGSALGAGSGAAEYIRQKYFEANGKEISPEFMRAIQSGLMGSIMSETDVGRMAPFAQGFFMFDALDQEEGITIGKFLGPSGAMGNKFIDATIGSAKLKALISGGIDAVDIVPTAADIGRDLLKPLAAYNRAEKAIHSYQTGVYLSNKGQALASNTTALDSALIAFGFPPLNSSQAFEAKEYIDDMKTKVFKDSKEAVRYLLMAAQAGPETSGWRRNMAAFQYYRDLYVKNDHIGTGAQAFHDNVTRLIKSEKAFNEEVFRLYAENLGRIRNDLVNPRRQ